MILTSLPIAGCSLAVSVAGGLATASVRSACSASPARRSAMLRRVVALEAAVPLVIGAVVSAGAGLLAAALFLRAQLHQTLQPLGVEYYALVTLGVLASFAVIASTLPMLSRLTGPETARND